MCKRLELPCAWSRGCRWLAQPLPLPCPPTMVLKDAVLDQLTIEAAFVGVVDFLGHQAKQQRTDLGAGLIHLNDQLARIGR